MAANGVSVTIGARLRPRGIEVALRFVAWASPVFGARRTVRLGNWLLDRTRYEFRFGRGAWVDGGHVGGCLTAPESNEA